MCKFLEKLGEHLLNLALLLAGALIVQPIVNGKFSWIIALIGSLAYFSLIFVSYLLMSKCDRGG